MVMASLAGFTVITLYKKFPKGVQRFALKHVLLTDATLMVATVSTFGMTATGLLAGGMLDVIITCAIHIANHPDDFQYIFDAKNFLGEQLTNVSDALNEFGRNYRESK